MPTPRVRRAVDTRTFKDPIVTQVMKLPAFYRAEDYHQDYATLNPTAPYIVINDQPKLKNFETLFPELYVRK